jgi:hypothetical protein
MPYALCPLIKRAPHVTEKGYSIANHNTVQQTGRTMKLFISPELLALAGLTFAAKTPAPLVVLPVVARQLDS